MEELRWWEKILAYVWFGCLIFVGIHIGLIVIGGVMLGVLEAYSHSGVWGVMFFVCGMVVVM